MTDAEAVTARTNMVDGQIRPNQVRDSRLLDALLTLPRGPFLPADKRRTAYMDGAVAVVPGRFLLPPMVFARLIQEAQIRPEDRVLDIGCLTGYSSAILARLAAGVVALDCIPEVVDQAAALLAEAGVHNVETVIGDRLAAGYPRLAPYDVIVCEGAVGFVPDALKDQLADGGRLLAVVTRGRSLGQAMLFERSGEVVSGRPLFESGAPALPGFVRASGFVFG